MTENNINLITTGKKHDIGESSVRLNRLAVVFIVLLFSSLALISPVTAQDEDVSEDPAEINARIIGDIPSIQSTQGTTKWTQIEVEISDAFGIDYRTLSETIPQWVMEILWPLNPSFPQPVKRYLGEMSFSLDPKIVEGNDNGWNVRMATGYSEITGSLSGDVHNVFLEVLVDDSSIDNSVTIGIKCTRKDTFGDPIGYSYIYVPVKASPTNYIKMETLEDSTKETGPKTIVDFTLNIKNEGYYKDVFEFEIEEENGLMALMNQQAITMEPGEIKRVTLEVLTPEKFFDPGTPNQIQVYVRSTGNSTKTLIGSLIVITKGFYFSPLIGIIAAPIIALLVIGYIGFIWYKNKRDSEVLGKPDKPWDIPAEKKYLKELKEKDEEKYKQVLDMMQEEYQSSMLWWKNSQQKSISGISFSFLDNFFSRLKKDSVKQDDSEKKEEKKTELVKKEKRKPKKSEETEKEDSVKKGVEQKSEASTSGSKSIFSNNKNQNGSVSSKLVTGLKKWFTVPEEEKRKIEESKKQEIEIKEDVPQEVEPKKPIDDYEQELDRIEKKHKALRAQKNKEQIQIEKEKAMMKIRRAQEKQRNKLKV